MNGSPGPIPWTAIWQFAVAGQYNEEETEYLVKMIRALDDEYLEFILKQTDKGKPAPPTPKT